MQTVGDAVLGTVWEFDAVLLESRMRLCFGDLTLDLGTRQLLRETQEIRLSPKAFELLKLLVEERPRALAKNELIERLWPSTYVAETNLASLVAEIRDATGDRAEAPWLIRTVHRFGYAFCATASEPAATRALDAVSLGSWLMCEGRQIPLNAGENIIGREPDATAWLDSSTVSRRHARIVITGDRAVVEDLGSKNGTQVHRRRIAAPVDLVDGDEIQIGSIIVTFRMPSRPGSTTSLV